MKPTTPDVFVELKSAPARRVLRGRGVVLKLYRDGSVRDFLKRRLLGRRPALRERAHLERARAAGLPVPEVISLDRTGDGEECLALRDIEGARSLEEVAWGERIEPARRRTIVETLGALVRDAHAAGLEHRDLHPGNVLLDGADRPYLIDLHAARFTAGPLPHAARHANLVLFGQSWLLGASRADRARFLRAYAGAAWRERARALEVDVEAACRAFWAKLLRRRWLASRHVERIRGDGWRGLGVRGFPAAAFVDAIEGRTGDVVKGGRTAVVRRVTIDGRAVAVKRFRRRKILAPLFDLFRGSRGRRNWLAAHALRMRRFPTAPPLAFAVAPGPLRLPGESAFAALWVDGVSLAEALGREPRERRDVLRALGRAIRRLHRTGFRHRDLKAPNWIVARDPAGRPEPTLIDLDGLRMVRTVTDEVIGRDLARLDRDLAAAGVSRTDRLRLGLEAAGPAGRARRRRILAARERREGEKEK